MGKQFQSHRNFVKNRRILQHGLTIHNVNPNIITIRAEQEKMRKIMVRVNEQAFRNLVEINLSNFYNSLSESDKGKISDQMECAEMLKKTPQYQKLEQALRILVKCNSNLYDTIIKERRELQENLVSLKTKQNQLSDSNMNVITVYNTSNLLQQVKLEILIFRDLAN